MKNIILITVALLIFVACSTKESEGEVGRYQLQDNENDYLVILDTKTGTVYYYHARFDVIVISIVSETPKREKRIVQNIE